MFMRLAPAVLAVALLGAPISVRAEIVVAVAPQREASTFRFRGESERAAMFRALADELRKAAGRTLSPADSLKVTLLDLRPAGRIDPFGRSDLRVLSGATPPTLKLRYALSRRGRVVAAGEETVTDLSYLDSLSARSSLASFPHERELVRDWFRERIVRGRPAPR